ncbi:MAG TPA: 3-oxoacyl-ACP reductase family protein [Bryobacteraceae bacterium]|nr:3-oxoacyl-ACP reductase family protein [Bryobacteraceae bacterium]
MTALVTGASRGIGRSIALRLAQEGLPVAVNYHANEAAAQTVVAEILAAGGRAVALRADTGDPVQVDDLFTQTEAQLGPVSILVNNAGILHRGSIDDYDPAAMAAMHRTNVEGVIHCTRAAARSMRPLQSGVIINISSIAAHGTAAPGTTWYAATKAAVETLTRRFALELGPAGIRVNAVAPGFILTDMVDAANRDEVIRVMSAKAVLGRIGTPDDIAGAVAFLASSNARFITGQILTVDGGRTDFLTH